MLEELSLKQIWKEMENANTIICICCNYNSVAAKEALFMK